MYWRKRDHCGWNGRLVKPQRPETNISFNTPDIQRYRQSLASYRSFTAFLAESVFCLPTRLLSMIDSFSCIYISQGSVATQLKCGEIFSNHFVANCPQNVAVLKFSKSVNIWRRYRQSQSGTFFGTQCISCRYNFQKCRPNAVCYAIV